MKVKQILIVKLALVGLEITFLKKVKQERSVFYFNKSAKILRKII